MSSNILVFNPNAVNQDNDATYAAESQRAGGIGTEQIMSSPLANKLFYQLSTMAAGIAGALAAKGYAISDANFAQLVTVLSNIVTNADLLNSPTLGGSPTATTPPPGNSSTRIATAAFVAASFATKNNAALTGAPTAPTPAPGDDSTRIATTEFAVGPLQARSVPGFFVLPSGFTIQWVIGPTDPANGSEVQHTVSWPMAFPSTCLIAIISTDNTNFTNTQDTWYQTISWDKNGVTYQRQFPTGGATGGSTQQAVVVAIGF